MSTLVLERVLTAPRQPRLDLLLDAGLHVLCAAPGPLFSFLLPCVAGLERPRRGSISLDGQDPFRTPTLRGATGTLFVDEPALQLTCSVRDYLAPLGRLRAAEPSAEPLAWPLDESLLDMRCSALDAFARRKLALHLALTTPQARLVALHEPFSTLEPGQEPRLLEAFAILQKNGAVVVVTTHDPRLARRLSSAVHRLGPSLQGAASNERSVLLNLDRPRDVAALLTRSPLVYRTQVDPERPRELFVYGADDDELSAIITRAIRETRTQVTEIAELSASAARVRTGSNA